MTIEVDTITLPSFLACALINGDTSDFDERDEAILAEVYAALGDWEVVGLIEDSERFTWSYSIYGGDAAGGDVADYIIHKLT